MTTDSKNTMKNKLIISLAVVVIVVVLILELSSRGTSSSVQIGGLYPLTGGLASYGEPAHNTALIAIDDINAAGGINGKKFELVSEDHKCDPKTAASAFQKLVSTNGIKVLTTVACSGTVSAMAPNLATNNVVLLGTVTSADKLTAISPNFFRNWASDGQEAKLLADRAIAQGYKSIAVIYEDTDYAKGLEMSLVKDLANSGVKITSESFASGATDVRTQLTKLQTTNADVVFVSVQTVPSGETVLTQMEQLGFKPKTMFVNDNILKAASLLKNHTALLEGAVGGDYVFQASAELNAVLSKYKTKYDTDCPQINICAAEYDAIQMLANAIRANGDSASGVKTYLSQTNYSGVSGSISFDQNNDRSNAHYSLFKITNGIASKI